MRDPISSDKTLRLEVTMLVVALVALGLVVAAAVYVALGVPAASDRRAVSQAAMSVPLVGHATPEHR